MNDRNPAQSPVADNGARITRAIQCTVLVLLAVYVFINPFPRKTAIELITFYSSTLMVAILSLTGRMKLNFRTPLTIPLLLFAFWGFLGLFSALDVKNSIHDYYAHLLCFLVLFFLIFNVFDTKEKLILLLRLTVVSGLLFSAGLLVYYYGIARYPLTERLGMYIPYLEFNPGFLTYTTLFTVFLSLGFLRLKSDGAYRYLYLFGVIVSAAASVLSGARAAFVGALAPAWVFLPRLRKNLLPLFVILIAGVLMFSFVPSVRDRMSLKALAGESRVKIAMISIELLKDYPVFGIGYGMQTYGNRQYVDLAKYNARLPEKYRQHHEGGIFWGATHNSYMDVAVRTGLVGLVLWLYVLVAAFRTSIGLMMKGEDREIRHLGVILTASLTCITVLDLFMDSAFGPQLTIHYVLFGMIAVLWQCQSREREHS
ncbi:MAG: O-antigen ligase family protein [Syntrophaceae bacterium]|nr:O-antigen ligase family protein [Syntrophaceae bacterium]